MESGEAVQIGRIKDGTTVLFQGDSITDAGRNRDDPFDMGSGYASTASSWFLAAYPHLDVEFLNRGISGNRIGDLMERWREDCLSLKPDWVSILIGINDCARRYDGADPTPVSEFKARYHRLLEWTKRELNADLILMEPFLLPISEERRQWREDLDPKIHAVRELAREYQAVYVPLDGVFAQAASGRPVEFWAQDGVHPSPPGHSLIAQNWLAAMEFPGLC